MILAHGLVEDQQSKMGLVQALFLLLLLLSLVARPYRNAHTNLINVCLNLLFSLVAFELNLKITGFKSTLFVDKYFFGMQVLESVFVWFTVFVYIILIYRIKATWNVNKAYISEVTAGQELAIAYILKAKAFKARVLRRREYTEEDAHEMQSNMEVLEKEFNRLATKQPIILDSMLETMEGLKQMRKNYEGEPDIYSFDYKRELDGVVRDRPKVYVHAPL